MGFAMRQQFNEEIIKKHSVQDMYINGKKQGFCFDVQLACYRGHYLSTIDTFEVYVDGVCMPSEAITFELKGKEMPLYKLKYAISEFWSQVELAKVRVLTPGGLSTGEHEIELKLMLHVPYMQIGPDHNFMPLDSGDKVSICVKG